MIFCSAQIVVFTLYPNPFACREESLLLTLAEVCCFCSVLRISCWNRVVVFLEASN